jgi:tRNA G10  N-methylase Trm11
VTEQLGLEGVAVPPEGGDFISTPREVVDILLRFAPPGRGSIVDPFAGGGAILSALKESGRSWTELHACEIRGEEFWNLTRILPDCNVEIGDWTAFEDHPLRTSSIITNPPFSKLPGILESCMDSLYAAFLMPIDELAGKQSTAAFFNRHGPPNDLIPIPWRVWPFVRGVAWYVWRDPPGTRLHIVGRS